MRTNSLPPGGGLPAAVPPPLRRSWATVRLFLAAAGWRQGLSPGAPVRGAAGGVAEGGLRMHRRHARLRGFSAVRPRRDAAGDRLRYPLRHASGGGLLAGSVGGCSDPPRRRARARAFAFPPPRTQPRRCPPADCSPFFAGLAVPCPAGGRLPGGRLPAAATAPGRTPSLVFLPL